MSAKSSFFALFLVTVIALQFGMGRNPSHYDQEAIEAERVEKATKRAEKMQPREKRQPAKQMASGVKDIAVDSPAGLISETAESAKEGPITGTLNGAVRGSEKVLDSTVKGAVKVATLGFGEVGEYDVREPEAHSGEPTKITLKIPGT